MRPLAAPMFLRTVAASTLLVVTAVRATLEYALKLDPAFTPAANALKHF